jgi:predicted RNA-binding protein with PIN domain
MAYLIDGNNLLGNIPDLDYAEPASRGQLLERLKIFRHDRKVRMVVVFDGPPDLDLIGGRASGEEIEVRFPEPGRCADAVIKDILAQQADPGHLTLVSSDRELRDFARGLRSRSIDSRTFARRLATAASRFMRNKELEKGEAGLSPLELRQWIDLFDKK